MAELDELKRLNEAQEKKKGESQQSRKEGGWPARARWPMTRSSWRSWGFWPFQKITGARRGKARTAGRRKVYRVYAYGLRKQKNAPLK